MTPQSIIRAIDPTTGDWVFGTGRQSYRTGTDAIAQDIKTALLCFLNDSFWNLKFGIDWINYLGNRGTENAIILACRQMISSRPGIISVNTISAKLNRNTRGFSLIYQATTIYSTTLSQTVAVEIPIGN
jgi:hypothetical protein